MIVLFMFLTSLFGTCNHEIMFDSNLPENSENIRITWNENGGMMYYNEKIEISTDSCVYELNTQYVERRIVFQLTKEKIDSLYSVFLENKFDKIKTYEEPVLDRGGTSINLFVDNQSYSVSNCCLSFIKKGNWAQYNGVENVIRKMTFDELENYKSEVLVETDKSIIDNEYYVKILINEEIVLSESKEGDYKQDTLKLFDENNEINVYFQYYQDGTDYLSVEKSFKYVLPNLPDDKKIVLAIEDGELIVK